VLIFRHRRPGQALFAREPGTITTGYRVESRFLKTTDQKSRLMRVVAPLGVLLPSGLGLKIDNNDVGRAGFVRCLPNGCVAEVIMDDTLVRQ